MTIVLGIDIKVDRNSLKKVLVEKLKQLHICLIHICLIHMSNTYMSNTYMSNKLFT